MLKENSLYIELCNTCVEKCHVRQTAYFTAQNVHSTKILMLTLKTKNFHVAKLVVPRVFVMKTCDATSDKKFDIMT